MTDEQLFAGANALALETAPGIWEVLQFGQATIVTTGRWKLTRLLRGQSGTEDAIVLSAAIGSRIVFLNSALAPLPVTETELGMPWNWRIGPVSRAAGDPINLALAFTPHGRGLRPWSPVRIKGVWQVSGDIAITWLRRTRALAGDSTVEGIDGIDLQNAAGHVDFFEDYHGHSNGVRTGGGAKGEGADRPVPMGWGLHDQITPGGVHPVQHHDGVACCQPR